MKRVFYITDSNKAHICEQINAASVGQVVEIKEPTRSLEQNAYMWPYLEALHKQLPWPVLISGQWHEQKLSTHDWKHILTGSFQGDAARMAKQTSGTGLIMLGQSTSGFGKKKFSEFIEFMNAFGATNNVRF